MPCLYVFLIAGCKKPCVNNTMFPFKKKKKYKKKKRIYEHESLTLFE